VDYVVNAWDMDDPQLTNGNKGIQKDEPTKLGDIKLPALRIYMADNEAGRWRPVITDEHELNVMSRFNLLDVWSGTHLPASNATSPAVICLEGLRNRAIVVTAATLFSLMATQIGWIKTRTLLDTGVAKNCPNRQQA